MVNIIVQIVMLFFLLIMMITEFEQLMYRLIGEKTVKFINIVVCIICFSNLFINPYFINIDIRTAVAIEISTAAICGLYIIYITNIFEIK